MAPAIEALQSWGLDVLVPDGLFDSDNQFAGSDSHRAALLQQLLDDDSIGAILCCRGGYGTVRIVDSLDFSRFARHPKWIVGYSDVTVLHSHIHATLGIPTLHATMPITFGTSPGRSASPHPSSAATSASSTASSARAPKSTPAGKYSSSRTSTNTSTTSTA